MTGDRLARLVWRSALPPRWLFASALLAAVAGGAAGCSAPPSAVRHPPPSTTVPVPTLPERTSTTAASATQRLTDIAFFNPTTGYGLFEQQRGSDCDELVGYTTDGGGDFDALVNVAAWGCNGTPPASALAFDDDGDGFLYNPGLFVTHDAGVSWSSDPQSGIVLAAAALGPSIWMVEADCPTTGGSSGCPLRLLESTDGGRSWHPSAAQPPGATAPDNGGDLAEDPAQSQSWLVRLNARSAYVVSNPVNDANGLPDEAPLWFTDDAGASWSERQIQCGTAGNTFRAESVVLSAAPDGTLLAVCAGGASAGYEPKSSARSVDGGVSWTVHFPCPAPDNPDTQGCTTAPFNSGYTGGIDAVSGDTAFFVGGRSSLMVTDDGGVSWQPVEPAIGDTGGGTNQVIFFYSADGVVLGDGGDEAPTIWSTSDGGAAWSALVPRSS